MTVYILGLVAVASLVYGTTHRDTRVSLALCMLAIVAVMAALAMMPGGE